MEEAAAQMADQRMHEAHQAQRMPPRSMMRPAKMKNGSASRTKLPVPSTMFCGNATIGTVSAIHR